MFQHSSNFNINGGAFINTVVNEKIEIGMTGLQILHRWVSDGAAHDSAQHAPVCHPDTRKTIIGEIMSWIGDPSRTSSVLWFNGPAGAGKTAIAQSLCKLCEAAQWLAGSFFFSRYAPASGRSNAEFLFPTIAFGLSVAIPEVGKIIDAVVASNPSIPTKALEIQLQKLILEPLQQISEESKQPIVIIIDGLDECEGEDVQSNVLRLLGSVFQHPSGGVFDRRVCFIVTSRPEPWIHDEFTIEPLSSITRQIFLGQTSEANDDIRTFLRLGFTEIHDSPKHRHTMSNVPKPWPSYRDLDNLVDKASGQFIYPATVLKFVGDPNYRPTVRLDIIISIPVISLTALAQKPLATLDQLYSQILSMSSDKPRTLEIIGALIAMQASISGLYTEHRIFHVVLLGITEKLLGLEPGDGLQALRMIHSLIHISGRPLLSDADDNFWLREDRYREEDDIKFHHKTFIDYLLDPSRSLEYCVDTEEMNTRLAIACIFTMQTFSLQPSPLRIAYVTWGYAIFCWTRLVTDSGIQGQAMLEALMSFDLFGCYLETLGPEEMESECRDTIKRVAFPSRPDTVASIIADKLRPENDIIEKTCPDPSDIKITRELLFSLGAPNNFTISGYSSRLEYVLYWMKKNPDSPHELITLYRVVVNVLRHYSLPLCHRPAIPNDDYFRDIHETPQAAVRFSIADKWTTKFKKLLKRRV